MLKKVLKRTLKLILGFFIGILIYGLCVLIIPMFTLNAEKNTAYDIPIYIKTNGVHTDIVLPIKTEYQDWSKQILFKHTINPDTTAKLVAFGWGDKGFYLETPEWKDLKFKIAFKAATGLGNSAMHTTFYTVLDTNKHCKQIMLSKSQYVRLVKFIQKSFKTKNLEFIAIQTKANYGKTDAFYEAKGSYSIFYTCNTWANEALKVCGQKCCLWTPLDKGIFAKYK